MSFQRTLVMLWVATFGAASIFSFACGGKPAKQATTTAPSAAAASAQATSAVAQPKPVAASPNVGVSDELAKRCSLRFANAEKAPKFGYDQAELLPTDR